MYKIFQSIGIVRDCPEQLSPTKAPIPVIPSWDEAFWSIMDKRNLQINHLPKKSRQKALFGIDHLSDRIQPFSFS